MIRVDEKTGTQTVHCDACGSMAPICAAPGVDPVALLMDRVQGWAGDAAVLLCPKCRALVK